MDEDRTPGSEQQPTLLDDRPEHRAKPAEALEGPEMMTVEYPLGVRIADAVFIVIENIMAFRVAFIFLNLPEENAIFRLTDPIAMPLRQLLPFATLRADNTVLEGSTVLLIVALIVAHAMFLRSQKKRRVFRPRVA